MLKLTPFSVFMIAFAICTLFGFVFQLIILPHTPWNAGNGLMEGGDWVWFFSIAQELAQKIEIEGWKVWVLRYEGQFPASLMAALFVITGIHHAAVTIPIYAALYAFSATLLWHMATNLGVRGKYLLISLAVLAFPSTVIIWGQPHKDIFALLGIILVAWAWLKLELADDKKDWILSIFAVTIGFFIVWLPRPYLSELLLAGLIAGTFVGFLFSRNKLISGIKYLVFVVCALVSFGMLGFIEKPTEGFIEKPICNTWQPEIDIPYIGKKVESLMCYRHVFIQVYGDSRTAIDTNKPLHNYKELFSYIPRAFFIALFTPFPKLCVYFGNCGNDIDKNINSRIKIAMVNLEISIFYLMLFGLVGWLLRTEPQIYRLRSFVFGLFSCALVIATFYAIASPNEGTLYRARFPEITLWWFLGSIGLYHLIHGRRY